MISVSTFDTAMLASRRRAVAAAKSATGRTEDLIFQVRPNEAVLVDGVHVYVQLLDYHDKMLDRERETEASHARVLGMLHLHYGACDAIAERFEAQRVDYHGPRKHTVVVSPAGVAGEHERVMRALAFADALKRTIEAASRNIGNGEFATRVRIGIDSGMAVAVNSGRGSEPEPLFLGSPANYAAKLADGPEEGIYLSDRVRAIARLGLLGSGLQVERKVDMSAQIKSMTSAPASFSDVDAVKAVGELRALIAERYDADIPRFAFHHHEPPLRSIDFAELAPSCAVRMDLVSVFADLSGFTKYVDRCIAQGRVPEMVANLHVLRKELAATLREDFGGKKVRFIGDCLHGLLAEGTRQQTDAGASVKTSVHAAGGLRSSFELCQQYLPGTAELGLAIGLEMGTTPICRLGLRGDRSVRCAVSKAVSRSEELQSGCAGTQTAIGPRALAHASVAMRQLFGPDGKGQGLDYETVVAGTMSAPAIVSSGSASRSAQPHAR
jgi:class 3 adenylate cyclase